MAILFVDQLTVIDCAVLDPQRGLLGESWIVDLELEGELDHQSMVLDFSEVKRRIKRAIDVGPDHTLLVATGMPLLRWAQPDERVRLSCRTQIGEISLAVPACSLTLIDTDRIDAAAVTAHCQRLIRDVVPESIQAIRLHLRTEQIDGAQYRYVHGLKKHDGACQRIAHGHRSRIRVEADGHRDASLEHALAGMLSDRYIVSCEDVVHRAQDGLLHTAYDAPEGRFELSLPADRCVVIDSDSTVECLADWLLAQALDRSPERALRVRAYEGINKGALASTRPTVAAPPPPE